MAYIVKREKTATGKNITINDVVGYKDLKLYGDTYQETYSGKNLFKPFSYTGTSSTVVFTYALDGSINCNGTADGTAYSMISSQATPYLITLSAGTYTISGGISSDVRLEVINSSGTSVGNTNNNPTFTLAEQTSVFVRVRVQSGTSTNNVKVYPQLESGSSATSYEPYVGGIPSPNPDYPQNVETVTGRQDIYVCGKNVLSANIEQGGWSSTTGQKISNSGLNRSDDYIPISPNTTYIYSVNGRSYAINILEYDNNKNFIGYITGGAIPANTSFTTSSNAKYITMYRSSNVGDEKWQLEKGTEPTTYTPYQGTTYEINLGKNLFDKDNANVINCSMSSSAIANSSSARMIYIPIIGGNTYTISKIQSARFRVATTETIPTSGVTISNYSSSDSSTSITITANSSAKYICAYIYLSTADTLTPQEILDSIQIEVGTQATTYAPYKTPIELCKINDARDYIYKFNDKWYLHKEIGKIILDGTEDVWAKSGTSYVIPKSSIVNANLPSQTTNYYCNYFTVASSGSTVGTTRVGSTNLLFNYDSSGNYLNDFKTWLGTHNTEVYYQLATPTDTEITDSELIAQLNAIELYDGTNYISTSSVNKNGELEINYYYDTKYDEIIYSGDARHKIKIWFDDVELEDADRYCEKLTRKSMVLPEDGKKRFSLDNFISQEIEIIFHNINASIIKDQVRIEIGTLDNGNEYDYIPLGIFNIQGTPTTDKNKVTIKLRDNRVKFDIPYDAKPIIDAGGGTATKKQILNDICTKSGVTSDVTTFYGENDPIGIYDNTINGNIYVSYIAEQAGVVPIITREGHLDFVSYANSTTHKIPLSILEKYEIGTPFTIQRVVYEDGIVKYETSNDETLETLYLNGENSYISRQEQIDNVFTNLGNFTLDSVTAGKLMGNPAIDPWDMIEVYGYYDANNHFVADENTIVFKTLANQTMTYNGKITTTYKTQIGVEERKENVTLSGEGTFRKYAKTEIDNINGEIVIMAGDIEDIEENITELITTEEEQTGLPMYIENAEGGRLIDMKLYGDTYQETYSGKNLFGFVDGSYYANEITAVVSNGEITLNGTANANAFVQIPVKKTLIWENGQTYALSAFNDTANNDVRIRVNSSGAYDSILSTTNFSRTITYDGRTGMQTENILIRVSSGITLTNFKLKPMLEKGSTATPYEKYVGGYQSPNPEFPQVVQTVTGKQEVEVVGENIFIPTLTADGTNISHPNNTPTLNADEYSLVASGTDMRIGEVATQGVVYSGSRGTLYEVGDADTIYLYCTNNTFNKNFITFYDENKVSLGYNSINNSKTNGKKVVENAKYFSIRFGYGSAVSGTTYTTKVMVSRHKITDYVPYTSSKYELNLGKNLATFGSGTTTSNQVTTTFDNSSFKINGTANASGYSFQKVICTLPAGTYTLSTKLASGSKSGTSFQITLSSATTTYVTIPSNTTDKTTTFTLTEETSLTFRLYVNNSNSMTFNNMVINVQIEKGSVASLYSPYKTPIELCKVNTYQDIIKKSTGKNLFDGQIEIGGLDVNTGSPVDNNTRTRSINFIKVQPNTKYSITRKVGDHRWVLGYKADGQAISDGNVSGYPIGLIHLQPNELSGTFTTSPTTEYIRWYDTNSTDITEQVQIELGDTPTDIEPYGVGKWYVSKKIGKVTLDGSESWTYSQSNAVFYAEVFNNKPTNTFFYTTHFTYIAGSQYSQWTNGNCGSTTTTRILCKNTDYTDTTQFKNWLSNHNVDVYYQSATSSYEEITDEELVNQLDEIELLTGINNVSITSEDLPADAYMKYYLKTPLSGTYVKHEEMNAEIKVASDQIVSTVSKQTDEKLSSYATKTELSTEIQQTSESINARVNKLYTNINEDTGEVESVTTTTGYTFDENGLSISRSDSEFNSLHDNTGTYYRDNNKILSQTTKDGTITKDMVLYGKYYYGVDDDLDVANFTKDDAMFIAELYTDGNNEVGFGHFLNSLGGN